MKISFGDLTDDEIIAVGSFCETVTQQQAWRVLTDTFEQQIFQHMMCTEAQEQKKREGIYASFSGVRDFIAHINALIVQKNKLTAPPEPSEDAPAVAPYLQEDE